MSETETLLAKIRSGDRGAFDPLFERYRQELLRAVELRLTPELQARFDASDVVQEVHWEAYRRLDEYLDRQPMPFGVWIRKTLHQRFQKLKRNHVHAKMRSVNRERPLPEASSMMIARHLCEPATSLSHQLVKREYRRLVQEAVGMLEELDREILLMRIVEGIAHAEIADVLNLKCDAVRQRYGRALLKLQGHLAEKGVSRIPS